MQLALLLKLSNKFLIYVKRAIKIYGILHNLLFHVLIQCIIIQNQTLFGVKNFVIHNRQKLKKAVLSLVCENQFIVNADSVKRLFKI